MPFQKGNKLNIGKKHSLESKSKMSLAKKGKKYPKMSERNKIMWKDPEYRKKMSDVHKGKLKGIPNFKLRGSGSHLWKGGVTSINKSIRSSLQYKLWRESVFKRDNFTCVWCGSKSGDGKTVALNADHIKPFSLFPELRFAIDNGRTLCLDCHKKTDTYFYKINKQKNV